jgi:hypothetical protein
MPSFLDRLFGLLNFIHAAEYVRRQIALRNFFFSRLFGAEPLPHKLSLSLLRGSRCSGAIIGLSSEKATVGKSTAINTRTLIRLKRLLLFFAFSQALQAGGWLRTG